MKEPIDPTSDPSSSVETRIGFEEKMKRIMLATSAKNDSELARFLGITPQSIRPVRIHFKIPSLWIEKISETTGISADWLFFGRGPMHLGESAPEPVTRTVKQAETPDTMELKRELDDERKERRALAEENRELNAALRQLMKDNAEIRERLARLEEQAKASAKHPTDCKNGGICGVA